MMKIEKINMNKLTLFLLLVIGSIISHAQTGILRGKIIDNKTGETLIGATIMVTGTFQGTTTDFDGNYNLTGMEPGTCSITCSFISFESVTVKDVDIKEDEVSILNFNLDESTVNLETVMVVSRARQRTEAALIVLQRKSASVLDGISSQQFTLLDDSDAASALKRVTGVTVENGKYVYVRGLGDRYSKTALNGADIPGLDPNRNTVQMDLFPANLIENIIIYKTFSPELPGSFTGGYVNVITKDFPAKFTFQVSNSLGYNTQSSMNDNFLLYEGGSLDWLGVDDGTRKIPKIARNRNFPAGLFINNEKLDQVTTSFNKNFQLMEIPSFMDHSHSISIGNQLELFGKQFGFIASLTYNRSFNYYSNGITGHYDLDQAGSKALEKEILFSDRRGSVNVLAGGILSASYKLSHNHKVGITLIRNQSGKSSGRYQEGQNYYHELVFQNRVMQFLERSFNSYQLKGEDYFDKLGKLKINWVTSFTRSIQNEPDLRFFQNALDRDLNGDLTLPKILSYGQDYPTRYYRDMNEINWDNKIDAELPFRLAGRNSKVKLGGSIVFKKRDFNEFRFDFKDENRSFNAYKGDIARYLSNENIGVDPEIDGVYGLYVMDLYQRSNNYEAEQTLWATYAMGDLQVSDKLRVIVGARLEKNDIYVTSEHPDKPTGELDNLDILPALNLSYNLTKNMNLKAAITRTLAYPSYRELAPFASFDYLGGFIFNGNPELTRTRINNFDLRWEFFPKSGEILAVSGFYKKFENPIEQVFRFGNDNVIWQNVEKATVYGIELLVNKSLGFVDFFKDFSFSGNFSYIYSKVDINPQELEEIHAVNPDHPDYRKMFGQSPYILNVALKYQNSKVKINSNLGFNISGEKIAIAGNGGTPNIMEQPFANLNYNISKTLNDHFVLKLSIGNILNSTHKKIYSYLNDEYIHALYTQGRTIKIKLKYLIK